MSLYSFLEPRHHLRSQLWKVAFVVVPPEGEVVLEEVVEESIQSLRSGRFCRPMRTGANGKVFTVRPIMGME